MPRLIPVSRPALPIRPTDGHKGTFGKVLIVGGSIGMSGAVCLSSVAALRSGSGLVTAAVPASIQSVVAAYEPCVMTCGLLSSDDGTLIEPRKAIIRELVDGRDAIAIGPGLGQSRAAVKLVRLVIEYARCPLVLDADALNICATESLLIDGAPHGPRVITPHPGEFARLTAATIDTVQSKHEELAAQFASATGTIVVLKGPGPRQSSAGQPVAETVVHSGTVVTNGTHVLRNSTGNAGMATGGSGDVLTGIVTSLLGQGMVPIDAASLAVHVHGLAGDIAAERFTQRGMIASDLLTCLPDAWRSVGG